MIQYIVLSKFGEISLTCNDPVAKWEITSSIEYKLNIINATRLSLNRLVTLFTNVSYGNQLKIDYNTWFCLYQVEKRHLHALVPFFCRHDYKSLLGVDLNIGLTKANRLIYGDSLMTHAMNFTACHFEKVKGNARHEKHEFALTLVTLCLLLTLYLDPMLWFNYSYFLCSGLTISTSYALV